jgi:hypothetical protein
MLAEIAPQNGGAWVFYVIAPVILCGVVTCLWWIVKGAIGLFGQTPHGQAAAKRRHQKRPSRRDPLLALVSRNLGSAAASKQASSSARR